jgi:glycosyltransferase involved in cell wall biosynthesis
MMRRTWSPSNLKFLRQLLFPLAKRDCEGYDVYHGHIYSSGLLACYLARKNNAASVNTIHGSYYPVWREIEPLPKALFYRAGERVLAPFLAKYADLQIHTSGYFAENVLRWGAPRDKIRVIPNGIDTEVFKLNRPRKKGAKHVLFTARRLVKKNGLEYLIKSMALLNGHDCQLYIAGEGPESRCLQALADSLGVEDNITFMGLLMHGEIPSYLEQAEIVVIPSIIEATSLFMLEAMAMGKAVVASRCGGLEEVINGENGILVEPRDEEAIADAVLTLLEDRKKRGEIERAAYETAQGYAWAQIAKKTEEEYRRITQTLT